MFIGEWKLGVGYGISEVFEGMTGLGRGGGGEEGD